MRTNAKKNGELLPLSPRQRSVLQMIAEGKADKEIAPVIKTTEQSVKNCVKDIRFRLNALSRSHAVALGLKTHVIRFPKGNGHKGVLV